MRSGQSSKRSSVRSIIVQVAPTSACRMARVASTSTMIAAFRSIRSLLASAKKACPLCAPVHCAAGSAFEMNFGTVSLATPQAD